MALTLTQYGQPAWMGSPLDQLPPKEKTVLALLIRRSPEPVSKEEILAHAWPRHHSVSDESIVRCISQLRHLVPQARIEAIYGFGYRLLPPSQPVHEYLMDIASAPADVVEKFMHALALTQKRTAISLARGVDMMRTLIAQQPDYLPARLLLAQTIVAAIHFDLNEQAQADMAEAWEQVRTAYQWVSSSTQSPPSMPPLLSCTHACLCDQEWRFAEARPLHLNALQGLPNLPYALKTWIWHLVSTGQAGQALKQQQKILALWPYSTFEHVTRARLLAHVGQHGAALKEIDAARILWPRHPVVESVWVSLHAALAPQPELLNALRALQGQNDMPNFIQVNYPYVLARCGKTAEARQEVDKALSGKPGRKAKPPTPFQRLAHAATLLELGDTQHALVEISTAYEARYSWLPCALHSPRFAALRQRPLVQKILAEIAQPVAQFTGLSGDSGK